jgi:hypothetical protein
MSSDTFAQTILGKGQVARGLGGQGYGWGEMGERWYDYTVILPVPKEQVPERGILLGASHAIGAARGKFGYRKLELLRKVRKLIILCSIIYLKL